MPLLIHIDNGHLSNSELPHFIWILVSLSALVFVALFNVLDVLFFLLAFLCTVKPLDHFSECSLGHVPSHPTMMMIIAGLSLTLCSL